MFAIKKKFSALIFVWVSTKQREIKCNCKMIFLIWFNHTCDDFHLLEYIRLIKLKGIYEFSEIIQIINMKISLILFILGGFSQFSGGICGPVESYKKVEGKGDEK